VDACSGFYRRIWRTIAPRAIAFACIVVLTACGQEPIATPTAAPTRIVEPHSVLPAPSSTPLPIPGTAQYLFAFGHDLLYPTGLAVDRHGDIYVIDAGHQRVQKYDANGTFVGMWGTIGGDDGQFVFRIVGPIPGGIAVDEQDTVYVSDFYDRVQEFTAGGQFLRRWGASGSKAGQMIFPGGLAVDGHGAVYVVDTWNARIEKFDRFGQFQLGWGQRGGGDGEFVYPSGIAVTAGGNVAVSDASTNRVQLFDADGRFLRGWSGLRGANSQMDYPDGLASDAHGGMYLSDNGTDRIRQFDSTGGLVAQWGGTGISAGEFIVPGGIAVDTRGDVYVADVIGGRILKFRR
jgi:tripartite motif-containing protein 71